MAPPPYPATPAPSTAGAQYAHQFLSTALSQRGPSALPYEERDKLMIRHHLVSLAEAFPSLHPRAAMFTHDDGRSVYLLQADGTLPIRHGGALYNLPIVFWLPERYPSVPPLVFLVPTRDMIVKPGHALVDRSGLVLVGAAPYLRNWIYPSSNLVELARSLSHLFGIDPPLYTRSPNQNPTPNPTPRPYTQPPPPTVTGSGRYHRPSTAASTTVPPPAVATEDPAEVYKRNAVSKLVDTVQTDVVALRKEREAEMDAMFVVQAELRRRGEDVERGLRMVVAEKEALEQHLQLVSTNISVMEDWMTENRGRLQQGVATGSVDADDVIELADVLSRQMLDCTAADLAAEDAIYALDKAVQEGAIPFDGYLKAVRALAREQFFQRALSARVRAAQVQAQVTSMASRATTYSS